MSQSRKGSLSEAVATVVAGYGLALLIQALLFPAFGLGVTTAQSLQIAAVFTLASLARSYILRRLFTRLADAAADRRDGEPAPASQDPEGGGRRSWAFRSRDRRGRSSFTPANLATGYPRGETARNPNECGVCWHRRDRKNRQNSRQTPETGRRGRSNEG